MSRVLKQVNILKLAISNRLIIHVNIAESEYDA